MKLDVLLLAAVFMLSSSSAWSAGEFDLKQGERVVSIDGVAVAAAAPACANGQCEVRPITPPLTVTAAHAAQKQMRREIRRDERAFAWAKREAKLCANNGRGYIGHPRGSGGYSSVGTGYSFSPDHPVHCLSEYPESSYKARACYHCPHTGRFYWTVVR